MIYPRMDDVIKHEKFLDVAFKVHSFKTYGNKIRVKGMWLNQGFEETFIIFDRPTTIMLTKDKLHEWLILNYEDKGLKCIRNGRWQRLT